MKKLLLILLVAAAAFPFQNCSPTPDDEVPTDTTKKDTTKPKIEPINSFKFNKITTYNLKWDSVNMFGTYRVGTDQTTIVVEGYSGANYAAFNLKFPGKGLGTFKYTVDASVNVEVTTGQGVKEKQYRWEPASGRDMIITVTKYDANRIKGTFSANLQESASITTGDISSGTFEVVRTPDE